MNGTDKENLAPGDFSVAVLYEDRETRDRALNVSRQMQSRVGDKIDLAFSWWRFDFLQDGKLAEQAAHAASVADMIVVASHPGKALPVSFSDWVEGWLPHRSHRESVLVAMTGSEGVSADHAATRYLREIAARAKMDYLAESVLLSSEEAQQKASPAKRPEKSPSTRPATLKPVRPPSHWGINE